MPTNYASEVWAGTPLDPKHQLWADDFVGQKELIYEDPDLVGFYRWCKENGWIGIPNSVHHCLNRGICRYSRTRH